MIDAEERAAKQRSFYLKLSPQGGGEFLAQKLGGFTPPGADSMEAEMRDNLGLWFKVQNSGAMPLINDTSWWMTRFMDPHNRMARHEVERRSDELQSYFIATMGLLLEAGVLKFTKEPEIPTLVTSTFNPVQQQIEQAILDRMEATMKKETPNEQQ